MCGIAGILDPRGPVSLATLREMTDRIAHRGPDAEGHALCDLGSNRVWRSGRSRTKTSAQYGVGLGHRRLSILDLSPAGSQPMTDADKECWIVFNGEVFNYRELREELAQSGFRFTTGTDTEVILAAWKHWGADSLRRFNGMWAFALWDTRTHTLFCARDRFGVKPFFYHAGAGGLFVFGSEIKALLAHPDVPKRPNEEVIFDFLSLGLADHTELSFFDGIRSLPASHYLTVTPAGSVEIRRWWDVSPNDEISAPPELEREYPERFAELLTDAVRLRLRSDVPIGTCLSGGLDSSAISMLVNRLMRDEHGLNRDALGDRQRTFSACFDDSRFDERPFMDIVLRATGASTRRIFPSGDRLWEEIDKVFWHMDEPFHSTSQYSQWNVMRCVREGGVTVTLDGQGSDELLAGYPGYAGAFLTALVAHGSPGRAVREAVDLVRIADRGRSVPQLAGRVAYGLLPVGAKMAARRAGARWFSGLLPEGSVAKVLRPDFRDRHGARRLTWIARQSDNLHHFGRRLHADVFQFSLPALLRYEDRNSMAFSIEARTPFLDYRLVELSFQMPWSMKIHGGWTKWVLRKGLDGTLPPEIQWRRDKKGFVTPEVIWLRAGASRVLELFGGRTLSSQWLDPSRVRSVLEETLNARAEGAFYTDVWKWIAVERWLRTHFGDAGLGV